MANTTTAPRKRRRTAGVVLLAFLAETLLASGALVGLYAVYEVWWTELVGTRQAEDNTAAVLDHWENAAKGDAVDGPPSGAVAVLHVPRFGPGWARAVYEGTTRAKTLNPLGIGHYTGSAGPGEVGNFALAGHRTTYSKPFNQIHTLEVGDPLVVQTAEGWYVYRVTVAHMVIHPAQNEVLAPVFGDRTWAEQPTARGITLTSCHPMYSRKQRYVVHGELDYSMPRANGTPQEITG